VAGFRGWGGARRGRFGARVGRGRAAGRRGGICVHFEGRKNVEKEQKRFGMRSPLLTTRERGWPFALQ